MSIKSQSLVSRPVSRPVSCDADKAPVQRIQMRPRHHLPEQRLTMHDISCAKVAEQAHVLRVERHGGENGSTRREMNLGSAERVGLACEREEAMHA